jgi:hypothetical protein
MVSLPFWLQQRGGKIEPVDERTVRLVGASLPICEVSVFPMPAGLGWRVSVDLVTPTGRQTVSSTESPFENEQSAWQAGLDLYRQHVDAGAPPVARS